MDDHFVIIDDQFVIMDDHFRNVSGHLVIVDCHKNSPNEKFKSLNSWHFLLPLSVRAREYRKEKKTSRKMKTIQYVLRSKGERKIPAKMGMCMSMVNRLPSEIIIEILSRLPTDSVLECRQVC
ncbi:hypothetical protein C5167_017862, partial [Papaver somniferum]